MWEFSDLQTADPIFFLPFSDLRFADQVFFCLCLISANSQMQRFSPYKYRLKMLQEKPAAEFSGGYFF
jgi:hypothetical protein